MYHRGDNSTVCVSLEYVADKLGWAGTAGQPSNRRDAGWILKCVSHKHNMTQMEQRRVKSPGLGLAWAPLGRSSWDDKGNRRADPQSGWTKTHHLQDSAIV